MIDKKLYLILGVAVVLLVAGIGYAAVRKDDAVKTSSETENWQTYKSQEYGFEVKYPSGWRIYDEQRVRPLINPILVSEDSKMGVSIVSYENSKNITPKAWLAQMTVISDPSFAPYKNTKYITYSLTENNIQGKTVATSSTTFRETPPNFKPILTNEPEIGEATWTPNFGEKQLAFQCSDIICVIRGSFPNEGEYPSVMDKILNTVKFAK